MDPTGKLVEKYFPGCHSDIGGGYEDNYLQYAPLAWMFNEMMKAKVVLDMDATEYQNIQPSINGTGVHNSNCWFWPWRDDHPILSEKELEKVEQTEREVFYYDTPQNRVRR